MDPMQLLTIVHMQMTLNNPLCHNKVTIKQRPPTNHKELESLLKKSYDKFKELKLPNNSVDSKPVFWFNILLDTYNKHPNKNQTKEVILNIPNGCCTNEKCPVKLFYEIIADSD